MHKPFDIAADLHTPVSAFLRLAPLEPRYLLESVDGGHLGRYSFIGFGAVRRVDIPATSQNGFSDRGPLQTLRSALDNTGSLHPATNMGRFSGGLVGVASFDLVRRFHKLGPGTPSVKPLASYLATESVLVFDHLSRRIALLHNSEGEHADLRRVVISLLASGLHVDSSGGDHEVATPSMAPKQFKSGVESVKRHIRAGDVYQLVLSIGFSGRSELRPFQVYRALRLLNPSPYMYYLDLGERQVVGSSPEALVRLTGSEAELWPIAGTRPRSDDVEEDARLEAELRASAKERAEHVMLVDLARNDLGRAAVAGSVRVVPFMTVERYSHVMHMVSGVSGDLQPGLDAFDLFAAAFPAGTVVGAPKLAAIELIDQLEPTPRDLYSGSVGYFGKGGSMDHAITIRTVVFEEDRYTYQAGAGIVADSEWAFEYEEVLAKGGAIRAAMQSAGEGI